MPSPHVRIVPPDRLCVNLRQDAAFVVGKRCWPVGENPRDTYLSNERIDHFVDIPLPIDNVFESLQVRNVRRREWVRTLQCPWNQVQEIPKRGRDVVHVRFAELCSRVTPRRGILPIKGATLMRRLEARPHRRPVCHAMNWVPFARREIEDGHPPARL